MKLLISFDHSCSTNCKDYKNLIGASQVITV